MITLSKECFMTLRRMCKAFDCNVPLNGAFHVRDHCSIAYLVFKPTFQADILDISDIALDFQKVPTAFIAKENTISIDCDRGMVRVNDLLYKAEPFTGEKLDKPKVIDNFRKMREEKWSKIKIKGKTFRALTAKNDVYENILLSAEPDRITIRGRMCYDKTDYMVYEPPQLDTVYPAEHTETLVGIREILGAIRTLYPADREIEIAFGHKEPTLIEWQDDMGNTYEIGLAPIIECD